MIVITFLIKEGFKSLIRSKYAGAFAILVIWIALIIVGLGFITARDALVTVNDIKTQFDIDIFLKKTSTPLEIKDLATTLTRMREIEEVEFISIDKAANIFEEEFGEDIFEILDYNPLPPSFTISLNRLYRNPTSVESIISKLRNEEIIDEIKYRKKFLLLLEKYQQTVLIVIVFIFLFLTLMSVLLISHSIKMTIFSRREIINTLKLIGATNNFIRSPFIIEGLLQGFIASCLASITIFLISYIQNNYLQPIFNYQIIIGYSYYISMIIFGSFMGFIGSIKAIRRFLA